MQSIFENNTVGPSQNLDDSNHIAFGYSFLPIEGDSHSRSPAIPLPKTHIRRTESENNLTENLRLAEFRDQCMFNRLVTGIQKQQQLLYNAETHDKRRQDSTRYYRVSRHRIQEEEDEEGADHHQDYFHSRRGSRGNSSAHVPAGYNARSTVIPASAQMSCLEENNKSIASIVCTRQQAMALREGSPPCSPRHEEEEESAHFITDDEDSDDFGPMFEMEI